MSESIELQFQCGDLGVLLDCFLLCVDEQKRKDRSLEGAKGSLQRPK